MRVLPTPVKYCLLLLIILFFGAIGCTHSPERISNDAECERRRPKDSQRYHVRRDRFYKIYYIPCIPTDIIKTKQRIYIPRPPRR